MQTSTHATTAVPAARPAESQSTARVSIIIPSWTGEVRRALASLERQTFRDFTVDVVTGVGPAGRARNIGAARATGEILVFLDDDAYMGHADLLQKLVDILDANPRVAVVGPSKVLPDNASVIQRAIALQVPRMVHPIQDNTLESNPPLQSYGFTAVTTTCCAIRKQVFDAVGGFDETLPTGPEDTEFFYRVRRDGHHIMLAGACWVYHDPPRNLVELLRKSFRYGLGHAVEARTRPERRMAVIPLDRFVGKLVLALAPLALPLAFFVHYYFDPAPRLAFGFRPFKTLSTYAVLAGYAVGWFRGAPRRPITAYLGRAPGSTALRVAMLTRRPPSEHGGVEHVVRAVTRELQQQHPEWRIDAIAAFTHSGGVESINGISDVVTSLVLAWRMLWGHYDIAFIHCPECAWPLIYLRRLLLRKLRVVAIWHGAGPQPALVLRSDGNLPARALAWFRCHEERAALGADAHIAVHESVATDLRRCYDFDGPVVVAQNAVEPNMLRQLGAESRTASDVCTVLWVGQADHRKGLDVAIEACRQARKHVPQLRLLIAGLPPRDGADWIDWAGVLAPEDIHSAYNAADVFLFPTRYESFGLVVVEAMAAGLPVIVSDAVPAGIAATGRNGTVITGHQPADYARALVDLWRDPDARARMAQTNRQDAQRFSWPAAAEQYSGLAQRLSRAARSA